MANPLHFHRRADDEAPVTPIPGGMTPEQVEYVNAQSAASIESAVRRYRRSALVGFLILLIGLLFVGILQQRDVSERRALAKAQRLALVESGRAVAVESCNRDFRTALVFRATIDSLRKASIASPNAKTPQGVAAIKFYTDVLAANPLPDCRRSKNLLTDNPEAQVPVVAPYFANAPYAPKPPVLDITPSR